VLDAIQHPQITKINLDQNLGISGATNEGLKNADGDFIVFLDHDDTLTVDCLYELVLCINNENPDYIYSDEDKLAPDGNYVEPHFKPSWSPDTMMSTMYTCHVSCVKKSILDSVGLLCSEYDGCQDWDFVLRVTEKTNRISHIPKVLYHWRIIPGSIASDINAKPYAVDVSRRVREAALKRRGVDGSVEKVPNLSGYYNVNYKIHGEPRISIIIPSRDNKALLKNCIDSIFDKTIYQNYELVIIDNGSLDRDTINFLNSLKKHNNVLIIRDDSIFNYSKLNNIGVEKSTGDFILFLNDDTEVISGEWLTRLASFAQLSHVGAVGAQLLYPNNTSIQHAGILNLEDGPGHAFLNQNCNIPGYFGRNLLDCNFIAVTGACLMIQRNKFIEINGFDDSFPVAYNDIDLCFRLLDKNYYNVVVQGVQLIHHESSSRGIDHLDNEKMERLKNEKAKLYQKNPSYFQYDPFYNINLHPNGINYELVN
jgi:GT2 family glycosyltransferase